MTSSTCFRSELRKPDSSTHTLFAPSEKSIRLSQNKQEFKRIPHFIAPVPAADSFTPGPVSLHSSITHPQKNSPQPLSGLPVSHGNTLPAPPPPTRFPCYMVEEATFGSSPLHREQSQFVKAKNPESNGTKSGHFCLVLFLTDAGVSQILNRYTNRDTFQRGMDPGEAVNILPKFKYKGA